MQPSIKNDLVYLLRILESIGKIKLYSQSFSKATDFFEANEQQNFNASLALLLNIGEQASRISDELMRKYPDVEWDEIKKFRNRIAHDYTGIDKFITYEIIVNDLPELLETVRKIISEQLETGVFNKQELMAAIGNMYYRHVDFSDWIS
ncbi:MAG TPA: HepT-like ribonuclease domain-containing protein [Bacteroidia bacterium]|nr:HepT-like ribonuclease domain-containing protein [Bacteroidia bacterium]